MHPLASALTRYCSTDAARPELLAPFIAEIDGERWAAASTGTILLAIRGSQGVAPVNNAPNVSRMFAHMGAPVALDLGALQRFVGADPVTGPAPEPCKGCGGEQFIQCSSCKGKGGDECECLSCGHEHEVACRACHSFGEVGCPDCNPGGRLDRVPPKRKGRIGGVLFDLDLVARAVAPLPPDAVVTWRQLPTTLGTGSPVMIDGGEWRVLIMPLRDLGDEGSAIPSFEIGTPVAGVA